MASTTFMLSPVANEYHKMIPDILYHYTTADGLIGIVNNRELWFSRYDCLNDAGQGKYILEVYKKTIELLEDVYDSTFLNEIKDIKPDYHQYFRMDNSPVTRTEDSESYYALSVNTTPYLCCFSMENDSLPMWNYYSKNGRYEGYNIGFQKAAIQDAMKNTTIGCCIYDEKDQIEILKKCIEEAYINHMKNGHSMDEIRNRYAGVLATWGLQFKHPMFMHEKEVRVVYLRPDEDKHIAEKNEKLSYRQMQGIIIPYLKKRI